MGNKTYDEFNIFMEMFLLSYWQRILMLILETYELNRMQYKLKM